MIRPVDMAPSQLFGDNPTRDLPWNHWLIQTFGNYQPDGHSGEDYPCKAGTPVRAVTTGTVLHVGWFKGTYADNPWWIQPSFAGYTYVVDHGSFIGIYGHCMDGGAQVLVGQQVSEGQILGPSGNTGASTGDHLHFEILPDGYILNSSMYGRINPASLFTGSLSLAGTITPLEDEMLTEEQDRKLNSLVDLVSSLVDNVATKKDLPSAGQIAFTEAALRSLVENVATKADLSGVSAAVASAVGAKATTDEIRAAVEAGMSAGLKVDVTVGGSNG